MIFYTAVEDQLEVTKKHLEQYKEIGDSNEQAIGVITKVGCLEWSMTLYFPYK